MDCNSTKGGVVTKCVQHILSLKLQKGGLFL